MAVEDEKKCGKVALGLEDVHSNVFVAPASEGMGGEAFGDYLVDRFGCDFSWIESCHGSCMNERGAIGKGFGSGSEGSWVNEENQSTGHRNPLALE